MNGVLRQQVPDQAVGMLHSLEFALTFMVWAEERGDRLTWQAISERWGVHRATAYRYLAAWKAFKATRLDSEQRRAA